jgi:hypothetical protein
MEGAPLAPHSSTALKTFGIFPSCTFGKELSFAPSHRKPKDQQPKARRKPNATSRFLVTVFGVATVD